MIFFLDFSLSERVELTAMRPMYGLQTWFCDAGEHDLRSPRMTMVFLSNVLGLRPFLLGGGARVRYVAETHIPDVHDCVVKAIPAAREDELEASVLVSQCPENVSKLLAFILTDSITYLIYRYSGTTVTTLPDIGRGELTRWFSEDGRWDTLLRDIATAVRSMRQFGIIHVDWKLANLTYDGHCFTVIDFGTVLFTRVSEATTFGREIISATSDENTLIRLAFTQMAPSFGFSRYPELQARMEAAAAQVN